MVSLSSVKDWQDEADVVIVGYGLSGAITAIEAHDTDGASDVVILEKMPMRYAGGNSRASGQDMFVGQDPETLMVHQRALNEPNPVPEDVLKAWAEAVCTQEAWITRMASEAGRDVLAGGDWGREHVEWPEMPGAEAVRYLLTIPPHPSGVWETFKQNVKQRPIRLQFEAPVLDLVQDPDTLEVFGVIAQIGEERAAIRARRGVVLCCGGYENDLGMLRNYWGVDRVYSYGTPGNTGDGVRMLQKAGAALWHLKNKSHAAGFWPGFKMADVAMPFMRNINHPGLSYIDIARDGRRFYAEADERLVSKHWHRPVHGHWLDALHKDVMPVHMIFDDAFRRAGPLVMQDTMSWNAVVECVPWSPDNSDEVDKAWILQAPSLAALAQAMGREPRVVAETVRRYNQACGNGADDEFGRDAAKLAPIEGPPYFAIEVIVGVAQTLGGGQRNAHAQVLDQQGRPIPRLYEAGELGSTMANLIQTGAFLTECVVFGRIAGATVVREQPWSN
jgi:succinate dehydrogenase/fumarate reductase flavoprotein subunit